MTSWLSIIVIQLNTLRNSPPLLLAIMSAFCIFTSLLALAFQGQNIFYLKGQWASLLHIFSALIATGFLMLAAFQAALVTMADRKLRRHPTRIPAYFPPLQSLEQLLFQFIVLGFLLMSTSLFVAFLFLSEDIVNQPLHKRIFSISAWITFAALLIGHRFWGWRGIIAAKWTIIGFILLSLGYFGSKIVLELILGQSR